MGVGRAWRNGADGPDVRGHRRHARLIAARHAFLPPEISQWARWFGWSLHTLHRLYRWKAMSGHEPVQGALSHQERARKAAAQPQSVEIPAAELIKRESGISTMAIRPA